MSLVVARCYGGNIYIVADTRVMESYGSPRGLLRGALKVLLIDPSLCVCFAGDFSEGNIRQLLLISNSSPRLTDILQNLRDFHNRVGQRLDFIVASLKSGPSLHRISHGKVESGLAATAIGDRDAFHLYQGYFHGALSWKEEKPPDRWDLYLGKVPDHEASNQGEFGKMVDAMRGVIRNESCKSVGDLHIAVAAHPLGFEYFPYIEVDAPSKPPPADGRWATMEFGTSAEGGYAHSVFVPKQRGVSTLGVHFLQGRFGVLFSPQNGLEPLVVRNVSYQGFAKQVKLIYGVDLTGPTLS